MNEQKFSNSEKSKPLRPNIIAGVGFSVSLFFSIYYSISNNYGIAEFSMLAVFGFALSLAAWGLSTFMNNVKHPTNGEDRE